MRYLYITSFFYCLFSLKGFAQTPNADFFIANEVCIEGNVAISNNSIDASAYEWDFCPGDLAKMPSAFSISNDPIVDGANNVTVVESDGSFFGFVASRYDGKLIRMDFGDNPDNIPQLDRFR